MWESDYKESWAPKNWCFWTVVLEKLLRVPWIARRSNQSILKEISPRCSLEGLILKLKLQYFGHLMPLTHCQELTLWERPWCWEGLGAGGEGDDRGWDGWMAPWTRWTWVWVNPRSGDRQGGLVCCDSRGHKEWDTTEQLNWLNWLTIRSVLG